MKKIHLVLLSLVVLFRFDIPSFCIEGQRDGIDISIKKEVSKWVNYLNIYKPFKFALLGDTRDNLQIYKSILTNISNENPAFVINMGDFVNKPNKKEDWLDFAKISGMLTVPYFLVVGNHDINDKDSENFFKTTFDLPGEKTYYDFTYENSHFFILNCEEIDSTSQISKKQFLWLTRKLENSTSKNKFVFVHRPLFPYGPHKKSSLDKYPNKRDELFELFKKNSVKIFFAGHEHIFNKSIHDGIYQIISGGGGARLYGDKNKEGIYHYIVVYVSNEEVKIKVQKYATDTKTFQVVEETVVK